MDRLKTLLPVLLALLLLAGCAARETPGETGETAQTAEETPPVQAEPLPAPTENAGYTEADTVFSVNYDPSASLNPLYGTNTYNCDVMSLLYEGLFRLGAGFEPEMVLCEDYATEDGLTYVFTLRRDVTFHDGSRLTAADVEYTINQAAGAEKYKSRLTNIRAVNATGDYELTIVLRDVNYLLPALLDIPVIKTGTVGETVPTGSGPYALRGSLGENAWLTAYAFHRDAGSLPLRTIYLRATPSEGLARAFSAKTIDLLNRDPTGLVSLNIHRDYETRYYPTAGLIYLGFNLRRATLADANVRRAVSRLVDRESIAEGIFGGAVTASPLVLSPELSWYDPAPAEGLSYSRSAYTEAVTAAGLYDADNDGYFDSFIRAGSLELTLVVNSENPYKTAAAEAIVNALDSNGFHTTLSVLDYEDYAEALRKGDFDFYLAEVRLTPDFDLSPLLTSGGKLNYGAVSDSQYPALLEAIRTAPDTAARREAGAALTAYAAQDVPLVPLCYKKNAVMTHVGVVSGMSPSQSGVFGDIAAWTVEIEK